MALVIVFVIIGAVCVFIFTLVGGLIGAPIFGKGGAAAPPPPPPPPPPGGYGGPGPGGPASGGYGQGV